MENSHNESYWQNIIAEKPDCADAYLNLAGIQAEHGNWHKTLELLNKANALQPNDPEIQFLLARAFFGLQDYERAYKILLKLHPLHLKDWRIYYFLANLEIRLNNNPKNAEKFLEKAQNYGCPQDEYHVGMGNLFWIKGQQDKGRSEYKIAVDLNRIPRHLRTYAISLESNDIESAINIWREITEMDPDNAEAYIGLARLKGNQSCWEEALRYANMAYKLDPDNNYINFMLGDIYLRNENYKDALKYYKQAREKGYKPDYHSLYNMILCCLHLSLYVNAFEYMEEIIKSYPEEPDNDELLASLKDNILERLSWQLEAKKYSNFHQVAKLSYEKWPDDGQIIAYFAIAKVINKESHDIANNLISEAFEKGKVNLDKVHRIKGIMLCDLFGERKTGIDCLHKAIELNKDTQNLISLAERIVKENPSKAETILMEVLHRDPENVAALGRLADICFLRKDWSSGLKYAQKGISIDPANSIIHEFIADAYYYMGKYIESLEFYQKALELDHPNKDEILSSIDECHLKIKNTTD